jgi:hypothetical protein
MRRNLSPPSSERKRPPLSASIRALALGLPDPGEEEARVARAHGQIHRTGTIADKEHLLPALAAVGRAEDAPLLVGSEDVTQRRHVDQVGVLRVDPDAGDLTRIVETHMGPVLAGVGGTVEADSR